MGFQVFFFISSCRNGKGVACKLIFPNRVKIEGNRETLLEILDKLDNRILGTLDKNPGIYVEFDDNNYKTEHLSPVTKIVEEDDS